MVQQVATANCFSVAFCSPSSLKCLQKTFFHRPCKRAFGLEGPAKGLCEDVFDEATPEEKEEGGWEFCSKEKDCFPRCFTAKAGWTSP